MRFLCMRQFALSHCEAHARKLTFAATLVLLLLFAAGIASLGGCQLGSAPQGIVICLSCGDVDLDVGIRKPIQARDDRPEVNPLVLP